jgi:hypothetical protein
VGAGVVSALAGAGVSIGGWMLFVPWDLSEVESAGNSTGSGGDRAWLAIAGLLLLVAATGIAAALAGQRDLGFGLTLGGAGAWVALFAWRVSSARTAGANMWIIPFVFFVLPAAVGVCAITYAIGRWRRGW